VAYSEHSSFDELRACVRDLAPSRIIPTVNCHCADKVRAMLQMLRPEPPTAPQNGAHTSPRDHTTNHTAAVSAE